jgi:hypothetical protein
MKQDLLFLMKNEETFGFGGKAKGGASGSDQSPS